MACIYSTDLISVQSLSPAVFGVITLRSIARRGKSIGAVAYIPRRLHALEYSLRNTANAVGMSPAA